MRTIKDFEAYGFKVEGTGGGCEWLRKPLGDGLAICITDTEAGLPEPDCVAQLFLMSDKMSEPLASSEVMNFEQMFTHVAMNLPWPPKGF